jgi:hypothetical protein
MRQDVTLTVGHFTYLQGESDTMFINDKATHLFWTQVVLNQDWGAKEGVLYDYSLQPPHSFRYGAIPFGPQPSVPSPLFLLCLLCSPALTSQLWWPPSGEMGSTRFQQPFAGERDDDHLH